MSKRKYFGTDGVRGRVGGKLINPDFALRLGYAAGCVLAAAPQDAGRTKAKPTVVIGKDTRISGYMLESALEAGLSAAGVDVMLAGPIPTPAVAYLTRAWRLAAGIVISASHNPHHDNGIKFFSGRGTKLPDATEAAIEAQLELPIGCADSAQLGRARRINDAAGRYIEFCKSTFPAELDLQGLRIVVDAANGAAYHIAPHVFRELGAEVSVIGCEPDGFNINAAVGATAPQALVAAVIEQKAHLGIALDGDADRLLMVDASGRLYDGDQLLYIIVRARARSQTIAGVVGTLMSNFGLERRLNELGIQFVRAQVGDRYVLEQLHARGWLFGGESSGHLLCLDRHTTGDGIIAALQVLAALIRSERSLAELTADLALAAQKTLNLPLADPSSWQQHPGLQTARARVAQLLGDQGRVLVRASGTEPILRLTVESQDPSLVDSSLALLQQALTSAQP